MSESADTLRARATELGFTRLGVARAGRSPHADRFLASLDAGHFASMAYLAREVDRRIDPRATIPGARSVIAASFPYDGDAPFPDDNSHGKIARYARGRDYHKVVTPKIRQLAEIIRDGDQHRTWYNVDNGPILERDWAEAAGLGWIGKNGLVIDPELGSWFFLAVIITDREYAADTPQTDHCGSCRRCLDACPTDAFVAPRTVDSHRCISYWTIEHRGDFPDDGVDRTHGWVFGCDICQEVCPFNTRTQRPRLAIDPDLAPRPLPTDLDTLASLTPESFLEAFAGTAVVRTKVDGLRRNAQAVRDPRSQP
ncbi:MAG: tRNA epoxyqueuosine(34) reductase QueG [Planctomycetota bacterium]